MAYPDLAGVLQERLASFFEYCPPFLSHTPTCPLIRVVALNTLGGDNHPEIILDRNRNH